MEYPVLAIKISDNNIYAFFSEAELSFTSIELLENGVFDDANFNVFLIKHIECLGWATSFWGYSLLKKGRQIKIKMNFEFSNKMDLYEVKSIISAKVSNNCFYDKDFVLKHLIKVKTMQDICRLFV